MGGYQLIVSKQNQVLDEYEIFCNKWIINTPKAAKVMCLLDLVVEVANTTNNLTNSSITLFIDNRKVAKEVNGSKTKANEFV